MVAVRVPRRRRARAGRGGRRRQARAPPDEGLAAVHALLGPPGHGVPPSARLRDRSAGGPRGPRRVDVRAGRRLDDRELRLESARREAPVARARARSSPRPSRPTTAGRCGWGSGASSWSSRAAAPRRPASARRSRPRRRACPRRRFCSPEAPVSWRHSCWRGPFGLAQPGGAAGVGGEASFDSASGRQRAAAARHRPVRRRRAGRRLDDRLGHLHRLGRERAPPPLPAPPPRRLGGRRSPDDGGGGLLRGAGRHASESRRAVRLLPRGVRVAPGVPLRLGDASRDPDRHHRGGGRGVCEVSRGSGAGRLRCAVGGSRSFRADASATHRPGRRRAAHRHQRHGPPRRHPDAERLHRREARGAAGPRPGRAASRNGGRVEVAGGRLLAGPVRVADHVRIRARRRGRHGRALLFAVGLEQRDVRRRGGPRPGPHAPARPRDRLSDRHRDLRAHQRGLSEDAGLRRRRFGAAGSGGNRGGPGPLRAGRGAGDGGGDHDLDLRLRERPDPLGRPRVLRHGAGRPFLRRFRAPQPGGGPRATPSGCRPRGRLCSFCREPTASS